MKRTTFRLAVAGASLAALASTFVLATSAAASGSIEIPAGDTATLSGAEFCADDSLTYGYTLNGGPEQPLATGNGQCDTGLQGATIGPVSAQTTLLVYLTDNYFTCDDTYYSDGTGDGAHALVTPVGTDSWGVSITDCGVGSDTTDTRIPTAGEGNLNVTVTVVAAAPTGGSASISGTAQENDTLTANTSGWSPTPSSYTYEWQDCNSGCTDISGASTTSGTYMLGSTDVGDTIQVIVTAHNAGGTGIATSDQTVTVLIAAPVNTVLPTISGTAQQGNLLTGAKGSWDYSPTSYDYQWLSCTPSNVCSDVGTNSTTYTPVAADIGNTIELEVTAHNNGGHAAATSAATAAVLIAAPVNTVLPTIGGTPQQNATLSASTGSWENSPSYTYQWERCNSSCSDITGATASSYVVSTEDVGYALEVEVTATNPGGAVTVTSDSTATVLTAAPANDGLPLIIGTAQAGNTLSATEGNWLNSPTSYADQWLQCDATGASCSPISGAQASSYIPTDADVGHTLSVVVTATNAGGDASVTSPPSAIVSIGVPANSEGPTISGTARQGQTLATDGGSWTNSPTAFAYQWLQCDATGAGCTEISGAQASGYVPGAGDVGHTLRVAVVATNSSGNASATSAQSAVVLIAPPANTAVPGVAGSAVQAQPLSASTGRWANSPTIYTYQWLQCDATGASCTAIPGAMASSYVPVAGDAGHALRVTVTATNASGTVSATSFPTEAVAALQVSNTPPPPVLDTSTNLNPVSGTILIRLPGSSTFTPVPAGTNVPIGSTVDAINGTVLITVALPNGGTQTGEFYDGEFVLTQSSNGTTIPILTGGTFKGCPAPNQSASSNNAARAAGSKKKPKTVVRQLWGNAHGNYTTKGRYGSASVSGTIWLVQDRCDGTYIEATKDNVIVVAYAHPHKKYNIKQGHHILLAAPGS